MSTKLREAVVINCGHSYYVDVDDPTGATDRKIRKAAFALGGTKIKVTEEEFKRGVDAGAIASPGDVKKAKQAQSESLEVNVTNVNDVSDDELNLWFQEQSPTVKQVLDAVGDDPGAAQRAKDAEETATEGEPRVTLIDDLDAIIATSGEEQ
jgi:hypothetical protein